MNVVFLILIMSSNIGAFLENNIRIKEPFNLFKIWYDEVCQAKKIALPAAISLATATKDGTPSVRMMMMKDYNKNGFMFCTDSNSRKGQEIEQNPKAAISFFWDAHAKSVRIEGKIEKLIRTKSDEFFSKMPKLNQISTLCAYQSEIISNRSLLENKQKELLQKYENSDVPAPSGWTCYNIVPEFIEFWQGQHLTDKIHDRIRFRKMKPNETIDCVEVHPGEDGWVYERLAP